MAEQDKAIIWSKEMFPPESMGQAVFPEVLEDRKRPSRFLRREASIFVSGNEAKNQFLKEVRQNDAGFLLNTQVTTLEEWLKGPGVEDLARNLQTIKDKLIAGLSAEVLPGPSEVFLLHLQGLAADKVAEVLVSPGLEEVRKGKIIFILDTLDRTREYKIGDQSFYVANNRMGTVLKELYGISSYKPLSTKEVAEKHRVTREKIRQTKDAGFRALRSDTYREMILNLLPNPSQSILNY